MSRVLAWPVLQPTVAASVWPVEAAALYGGPKSSCYMFLALSYGLQTKATVFVSLCRALAQLFVLRDHMEVAGRGPSGADPVLESGAPPFCVGLAKPLVYLALPSSLLS